MTINGETMYQWASELFPICRSLTGPGVRETLEYIGAIIPQLTIHEVPTGTQAFDWTVPDEWSIREAYIEDASGARIIDFAANNLHVMGYSEPVDTLLTLDELEPHLYSLPEQPDAIPYVTSYYQRRWGFCLSHNLRRSLQPGNYRVLIDSTLAPGSLTYSECILPGENQSEVLLSTYICHPSMANNETSGPVLTTALAVWLSEQRRRRHSYRIVFLPENLGSIVYLSRNMTAMKQRIIAGFVLSCVGDDRAYSFLASRKGDTLADRVARHVLKHHAPDYREYSYLWPNRGSDERNYCSPGVDLPVVSMMRSKYGTYPEYHTSLDDMNLISPPGFQGAFEAMTKCLTALENNHTWRATMPCEPQLGKRGLYPTMNTKATGYDFDLTTLMNILAYADGDHDVIKLADRIGVDVMECLLIINKLSDNGLLERIVPEGQV